MRAALDAGEPVQCVVVPRAQVAQEALPLLARAEQAGLAIERVGARKFERLRGNHSEAPILALIGPTAHADLYEVMTRGGAVWLLTGPAYPGNVGFAIRTAEVSGADGLYIDNEFDHQGRREARRASMRADRFMPVAWERSADVLEACDEVVRIPMAGFVASYNLQAAVAAIAVERFRQLEQKRP